MNFRSFQQMTEIVRRNLSRVPVDIDLVVGIPRSGLVPASIIALHRNLMLTDVEGLLSGKGFEPGVRRDKPGLKTDPSSWRKVLLVDDSVMSGGTIRDVRARIEAAHPQLEVVCCAIIGERPEHEHVDIVFDVCPRPRIFEWNFLHHEHLTKACVDIDGVLCMDPEADENDDGLRYEEFLCNARPYLVPTVPIGTIVSSRLEKYRDATEKWLAKHGIRYNSLELLDMESAEERRRLKPYAEFKASVYQKHPDYVMFIESEIGQAGRIAEITGRSVICVDEMRLIEEGKVEKLKRDLQKKKRGIRRRMSAVGGWLGLD